MVLNQLDRIHFYFVNAVTNFIIMHMTQQNMHLHCVFDCRIAWETSKQNYVFYCTLTGTHLAYCKCIATVFSRLQCNRCNLCIVMTKTCATDIAVHDLDSLSLDCQLLQVWVLITGILINNQTLSTTSSHFLCSRSLKMLCRSLNILFSSLNIKNISHRSPLGFRTDEFEK